LEEVFRKLEGVAPLPVDDVEREELSWPNLPDGVSLVEEHLPEKRLEKKRRQVENMIACLKTFVRPGHVIVEFCCGSGHVALVAAHLFKETTVVLVDSKQQSLERARQRAEIAKLTNVAFVLCNLESFDARFHIGVGLHACGSASDMILDKCWKSRANFVVAPCCYGAVSFVKPHEQEAGFSFNYPQSKVLKQRLDYEDYLRLAHSADQNHDGCEKEDQGRMCMAWVDSDRLLTASEHDFHGRIFRMTPHGQSSLKDHVLVGRLS
jgi:SAM-dependent methyltransferase